VLWFSTASDGSDLSSQTPQLVLNSNVEVAFEVPDNSY